MQFPDIENLALRVLAAVGIQEPLFGQCKVPDCEDCAIFGGHYGRVRDVLQAAFDEAMRPDKPPAPVPALELVGTETTLGRACRLLAEATELIHRVDQFREETKS